jgi:hypothetical protein
MLFIVHVCETWSLTWEKHALRVFGPKRDEVTGDWRKLHSEELHKLYSSPSIIRMIKKDEMIRACNTNGEKRNAYRMVGKPEMKRPMGRTRRSWVNNIKMDLGEIRWDDVNWIDMAQNSEQWRVLVNMELNLRVP